MFFVENSYKTVFFVTVLMLASAANAQKLSDLIVVKDAKPGLWASTPTQIPKGLEAHMKSENLCVNKEQFLEFLNRPAQMMGSGKSGKNACPTTVIGNTLEEAVMKIKCSEKSIGGKAEATYSIKRTANDTWAFTWNSLNGNGAMSTIQTTMKFLGASR